MSVLTLKNVTYKYEGTTKNVLNGISSEFDAGKVYAIVGKSGSGKSTLLSLIAGLDNCTGGAIWCGKKNLKELDRDSYRSNHIGVVFQAYNLLTNATAVENIVLSMYISNDGSFNKKEKRKQAYSLLEKVGIDREKADRKVLKLSGGEQQRVGIARALSHNPEILIADEPTGNLDNDTEDDVLEMFTSFAREEGKCVIIVTHSSKVASVADVKLNMKNGELSNVS
ncbi:MAG: ABC transporter ATP-binding protein [Defluviitaleaceae bacterium]|nr:ABC transporter ATP-binding protein [Defluviitaleaceae bacterium]MCL2239204.1 ABC transporter ATP-binding protein [Defluviitaleaceae bacterium]MCL2240313.1 ABC transporter ATP-binding protein [Defluviitaleaceae bacterium]